MGGVARSELVTAVTEAGGFGFLGMVREPVSLIRTEVAALRGRGIKNFGVNLVPAATDRRLVEEQISACIDLGVPVVGLFWDVPLKLVARLRAARIVVVCQVGSRAEAQAVEQAGAQIIIAQGVEAGGHVRGNQPLHDLVPEVVAESQLPVLGAGGLVNGGDLASVLSLGAQGGVFGTSLIATLESYAHDYHKQRLLDADGTDTVLTDAFHINWPRSARVRVLANSVTRGEHGDALTSVPSIIGDEAGRPISLFSTESPLRSTTGTLEAMALYAGTGVGRITEIVGAADRVRAIASEAERLLDLVTPPSEPTELTPLTFVAHKIDGGYKGITRPEELMITLNELLEVKGAGARVTLAMAREAENEHRRFILTIHRDEARWCGFLIKLIRHLNGVPSRKIGAFYNEALTISNMTDRLAFLNRGQGWVVRRLRELLPAVHDAAIHADLTSMLVSHERSIDRMTAQIPAFGSQGGLS
jgi:nitronate monooxygenase